MNAIDQAKVIRQGFTIIRERDIHTVSEHGKAIKYVVILKNKNFPNWSYFETNFKSKSERHNWIRESLKNQYIIKD